MSLSDNDLEFIIAMYDAARSSVVEKERSNFAEHFLQVLDQYGFDIAGNAEQISEHDKYLETSVDEYIEHEEVDDTDEEDEWD